MEKTYGGGGWSNHANRSTRRFYQQGGGNQGYSVPHRSTETRFTPYVRGGQKKRHDNRNRRRRGDHSAGEYSEVRDTSRRNKDDKIMWYKILIPYGKKIGKDFIMKSLHSVCRTPFSPVNFYYNGNAAIFYVVGIDSAMAVRDVNRKITTPDGYKMAITMNRSPAPVTTLDDAVLQEIKTVMSDRYNVQTKQLNMSEFHEDPALKKSGVFLPLQRKPIFDACVKIIKEHIPDLQSLNIGNNKIHMLEPLSSLVTTCKFLKSINLFNNKIATMNELNNIKGMQIEELVLDGNPLCDSYKDQSSYISAVREKLPKVTMLDGQPLPAPIGFDLGTEELPPVKGSFFPSNDVKQLVVAFLEQYFVIFDSSNRNALLDAYHDQAQFSLSISKLSRGGNFREYGFDSRNLIHVSDNHMRYKLLSQGKLMVVSTISKLPTTRHDPSSFTVDVSHVSPTLMVFTVMGVFKEVSGGDEFVPLRTFSRTFIVVPNGPGFVIINETLMITNATVEQLKAHKMTTQTASPSPVPTTDSPVNERNRMAVELSNVTGMNIGFSARCLEENEWNFQTAMAVFRELQSRGSIPPEAFQK